MSRKELKKQSKPLLNERAQDTADIIKDDVVKGVDELTELSTEAVRRILGKTSGPAWWLVTLAEFNCFMYLVAMITCWNNLHMFGYGPQLWFGGVAFFSGIICMLNWYASYRHDKIYPLIYSWNQVLTGVCIVGVIVFAALFGWKWIYDASQCASVQAGTLYANQINNGTSSGLGPGTLSPLVCTGGTYYQFIAISTYDVLFFLSGLIMGVCAIILWYYSGAHNLISLRKIFETWTEGDGDFDTYYGIVNKKIGHHETPVDHFKHPEKWKKMYDYHTGGGYKPMGYGP